MTLLNARAPYIGAVTSHDEPKVIEPRLESLAQAASRAAGEFVPTGG